MASVESKEFSRTYEGARMLGELLQGVQARYSVEEVKALFAEALAGGDAPSDVFPLLFEGEPRFESPLVAQKLYSNLFGLWDRLEAGEPAEPPPTRPDRPVAPKALPVPASTGAAPDEAFVELAFKYIASLPEKDRRRWRDRFEQRESELIQALATLKVEPAAEEAGVDMGFELWLMAELALGSEVGRTDFGKLRAGAPAGANPALEAYLTEWLEEAMLDEQDPLSPIDRDRLQPMLTTAIAQLVS